MSRRMSFWLAIALLFIAAVPRLIHLDELPNGLNAFELRDVQIAERIRSGQVEVLYEVGSEGREGIYHVLLTAFTTFIGNDPVGYRIVSVWFMLLATAAVYSFGRLLYGRPVGLMAMAAFTVPLWSIHLSRTISRESILPLMTIAVLIAIARSLPVYRRPNFNPGTVPFMFLGLMLGFGFYIHPGHYLIVLMSMAFIAYMVFTRQTMSRRTLSYLSFSIVILIIVATPYLISTLRRPELGSSARFSQQILTIYETGILQTVGNNLLGLFYRGDANLLHNVPLRPLTDPLSVLVMLVGVWSVFKRFTQPRYGLTALALIFVLPFALFSTQSPNFMGYVMLLPVLALLFSLGIKQLQRNFAQPAAQRALNGFAVSLLVFNLGWSVYSYWGVWGQNPQLATDYNSRIAEIAQYLDATVSTTNTVVCVREIPNAPMYSSSLSQNSTLLSLMMDHPDAEKIRYVDCGSGMIFSNGGAHQQVILLEENTLQTYPEYIQTWLAQGDLIQEDVPANSVISLIVSEPLGDTIGRYTTTAPVGYAPESPGGVAPALLPIKFEQNLTFLGYESNLNSEAYQPADVVTLITYWRTDGTLPRRLNLFAHVLFDAENIVSQVDTISVQTERLTNRDVFIQIAYIPLPADLPSGTYQISVGAYQRDETDTRLAVIDPQTNAARGTRLFLSEIEVIAPSTEQPPPATESESSS